MKSFFIYIGIILLFIIVASACSAGLEKWDEITGYGIGISHE